MATDASIPGTGWPLGPERAKAPAPDAGSQPDEAAAGSGRFGLRTLYAVFGLQLVGALVFVSELWSEVLGLRTTPIPYEWQELIQILASISLVAGAVTGTLYLRTSQSRLCSMRRQMDVAAGNFQDHLQGYFRQWSLSPSECAVAIYAMKGFSNAEVAEFRGTSASTVKSQMNAIYRKSGFANRQQLISFLVEDLLAGVAMDCGKEV